MKILVLALAVLMLIGSASAAVITATQSYTLSDSKEATAGDVWEGGSYNWFNNAASYSSGTTQNVQVGNTNVATVGITNWQNIYGDEPIQGATPTTVSQYGSSKLVLDNTQEPGNALNTIEDVQFEAKQGSSASIASEGLADASPSWCLGYYDYDDAVSTMGGTTTLTVPAGFLNTAVQFQDTTSAIAGADAGVWNCYEQTGLIKNAVFGYDAVSSANVIEQGSIIEHADIDSGASVSAYAVAKVLPEELDLDSEFDGVLNTWGSFCQTATINFGDLDC